MANEQRLIDANEYRESVQNAMDKYDGYDALQNRIIQGLMEADDLLDQQPIVDVVEVVHGWWEQLNLGAICRCCNNWNNRSSKYCPNCGAKMDGGNEDV